MNANAVVYLDSSAIVKLIVAEAESEALVSFLGADTDPVSSALARTEVMRAAIKAGGELEQRASWVLDRIEMLRIGDGVLSRAGTLRPDDLRSLDAIHLASALEFGGSLRSFVSYDIRLNEAASVQGIRVESPS